MSDTDIQINETVVESLHQKLLDYLKRYHLDLKSELQISEINEILNVPNAVLEKLFEYAASSSFTDGFGRGEYWGVNADIVEVLTHRKIPFNCQLLNDDFLRVSKILKTDYLLYSEQCSMFFITLIRLFKVLKPLKPELSLSNETRKLAFGITQESYEFQRLSGLGAGPKSLDSVDKAVGLGSVVIIKNTHSWTQSIIDYLDSKELDEKKVWEDLYRHLGKATATSPSASWIKKIDVFVDRIGAQSIDEFATSTITNLLSEDVEGLPLASGYNLSFVKGLVFASAHLNLKNSSLLIGQLAEYGYKKKKDIGAYASKLGNVCISTLGEKADDRSISELFRLGRIVKYSAAQKKLTDIIKAIAKQRNSTRKELEAISVPDIDSETKSMLEL